MPFLRSMYKIAPIILFLVGSVLLPEKVIAQVLIHEVAWMGTTASANAEWIELYNSGTTPVSLSGWTLTSSGTAPQISLSGSIGALSYALLERTSDASVPSVTAHQIYTGALSNSGDTLTLKDAIGVAVDTVVGGSNWSAIGGDNTTKHTPQRTSTGWVTAVPTPGAENAVSTDNPTETPETQTETATTTPVVTVQGAVARTLPSTIQVRRLYIDAGPPRIVQAQVPAYFEAVVYDSYKSKRSTKMTWSFGNGERLQGEKVMYTYKAPGTYTIVVRAHDGKQEGIALLPVEVRESAVSIRGVNEYGVVVENSGTTLIDFSNWLFVSGSQTFTVPQDTVLGASSTVVFTYETLGFVPGNVVVLYFPTGKEASSWTSAHADMKPEAGVPKLLQNEGEGTELPITTMKYESHIGAPTVRATLDTVGAVYGEVLTPLIVEELVTQSSAR